MVPPSTIHSTAGVTVLSSAATARRAHQRFAEDAWAEPIREFVAEMDEVSVPEVLIGCLQKPKSQWTTYDQTRVGVVLAALGRKRKQVRVDGGRREWRYFRGDAVVVVSPVLPAAAA
jgi:hypothetical protein